jgi:site-specific DNA recombinase
MKTRKAILYVRVSTDEQAKKGHSLAHQEERLRSHCLNNRIEVVAFFKEDHSAKSFERLLLENCLDFVKANKNLADMLLFLKWDRFSRNAADAYAMINKLLRMGIEPQAMEQPLNMETPEHKFMLAIYLR